MTTDYIYEKYRSERSRELALVCDIRKRSISVVFYDLALQRQVGRGFAFGGDVTLDTLMYQVRNVINSTMNELSIAAEDIKKAAFGAPAAFSTVMLLQYYSPEDYLLSSDTQLMIMPHINVLLSGSFTAMLASVDMTDGTTVVEISDEINIVWLENGCLKTASYQLAGAFVGDMLSCGMLDEKGAIDDVWYDNDGTLCYSVEGDGESCGVSASGAVSALNAMIKRGIVDSDGIMTDRDMLYIGENYYISQADVRAMQADKAMIAAVLSVLSDQNDVYFSGEVFSANGMKSLTEIGAVPAEMAKYAGYCRSSSEQGMINILCDDSLAEKIDRLCENCEDITEMFREQIEERYIEKLSFE